MKELTREEFKELLGLRSSVYFIESPIFHFNLKGYDFPIVIETRMHKVRTERELKDLVSFLKNRTVFLYKIESNDDHLVFRGSYI